MATKAAYKRLNKEFVAMQKDPPPFVWAVPDEKNILVWNYIIRGPPDSPYVNGEYHGVVNFPPEYPFKPPGIMMLTPSGRFQPGKKICFSMSDFHPGSWNPAWSVATILTGLLSFMLADEMTTGSVTTSLADKRAYAARSHAWNLTQKRFREAFPDHCATVMKDLPNMAQKERGITPAQSSTSSPASPSSADTRSSPGPDQRENATSGTVAKDGNDAAAKSLGWGQIIWEKWRWGILIALAVLVSRFSSTT
ncbi:UBC-like protein [Rickenella mellea]|uniref:Ubiquitin-conjugating enzyme E2 6 n=1 Tax=Rickenella mellea TaxID=50990 RepID=A0A4Y7Q8N6_9AGAM|nr:UBC-like protein [Rickenella mellea]